MMHHDQSKIIPNEFIYHSEARYVMDDGMIDEIIMPGNEPMSELTHLETGLNKSSSIISSNSNYFNDDYFQSFTTNYTSTSSINSLTNNTGHNNQYSFHTLQPASQNQVQTINNHHQNYNQYLHHQTSSTIQNQTYISIDHQNTNQNNYLQNQTNYTPKLITRTGSFNSSSIGNSSASSPSSLSSSSTCMNLSTSIANTNININNNNNNNNNIIDQVILANQLAANDPTEIARLKKLNEQKLSNEEIQLLAKDRQRKDNHNMIERRRRFNINDRIKELGQLLPKNGEFDTKQNKGSILKASVDFITQIKCEVEELRKSQETYKYLLTLNKKLCNRIKELEIMCRSHGLNVQNQTLLNNNYQCLLNLNTTELDDTINNSNNISNININSESGNSYIETSNSNIQDNQISQNIQSINNNEQKEQNLNVIKKTKTYNTKKRAYNNSTKIDMIKQEDIKEIKMPKQEPISPNNQINANSLNNEISSPSISSTSPLVKLMTSNSKDPILTSSSVSSPSSSPSPTSTTTSSSTNFFPIQNPKSPSPSSTTTINTAQTQNQQTSQTGSIQIQSFVNVNDCF